MGKKKDLKIERQEDETKFSIFQLPTGPRKDSKTDIGFGSEEEYEVYKQLLIKIKDDINKDSKIIKFRNDDVNFLILIKRIMIQIGIMQ